MTKSRTSKYLIHSYLKKQLYYSSKSPVKQSMASPTKPQSVNVNLPRKQATPSAAGLSKKKVVSEEQVKPSKHSPVAMQRSGTFLKDEPTVIGKLK